MWPWSAGTIKEALFYHKKSSEDPVSEVSVILTEKQLLPIEITEKGKCIIGFDSKLETKYLK